MVCDAPRRQCLEWHVRPKLLKAVSYTSDDGGHGYRALCPNHDDRKASFAIDVTTDGKLMRWQCFACNDRTRERRALIAAGVDPGCLPRAAREKEELLDWIERLTFADTDNHAEVRLWIAAALTYDDRKIPGGGELGKLVRRTRLSLSRAYDFRKRGAPVQPDNTSSYTQDSDPVKRRRSA